jgi:hypothetical protein
MENKLRIYANNNWIEIIIDNILYCEADGDYTKFFMKNLKTPYFASGHLNSFRLMIGLPKKFIDISRWYLVNRDYYISMRKRGRDCSILLHDDVRLQIPYRRYDALYEIFNPEFEG